MPGSDFSPKPNIQAGLLINRLLYEGRGDELLTVLSDLVRSGDLKVSEAPVRRLLETVTSKVDGARAPNADREARE